MSHMKLIGLLILSAIAALAQSHSITLTCSAPATGSAPTGYVFLRSTTSGGSYTQLNATPAPTCSYVDTAVTEGTKYFYIAESVGPGGTSAPSNEASATVPFSVPNPPSTLSAVAK